MNMERSTLSRLPIVRDLALLNLIVLALAVPFLRQPFHMDDNFYMDMARNALKDPLFPNDTPYVFEGHRLPDMGSHSHPPFQTYFLAAIQSFAGEGPGTEWIYHTCGLLFQLLAVTSMYFLCARLVDRPLWPSLALAFAPVFMVMGHTMMTDLPALSLWLAGITAFVWATEIGSGKLYAASAILQFLALFTSYHSALSAPLLGFYMLRKKGKAAGWVALLLPLLAMMAWFALNFAHYHRFLLVDTAGFMESRRSLLIATIVKKVLASLQYQGWLIIFPFFVLCVFARGLKGRLLALAVLASIYAAFAAVPNYRPVDKAIFVCGMTTGLFVVGTMGCVALHSLRRRAMRLAFDRIDAQFLGIWYFAGLAVCLFVFVEGSARYVLVLIPPVLIVFFRQLELIEIGEYRTPGWPLPGAAAIASGSAVLTLTWALVLSHADLEFARFYPRMAMDFERTAGSLPRFYGGEWGFRYYMSRAGIEQLPVDESSVRGGSMIALPRLALPYDLPAALREMTVPVREFSYSSRSPVKIMDRIVPAGFYSTGWGMIPFSFSWDESEHMTLSQVDYLVAELPAARMEGTPVTKPYPGFLTLDGRTHLALIMESGTTVIYPWSLDVPVRMSMVCGLSPGRSGAGEDESFDFRVVQRDAQGNVLASSSTRAASAWQRLELELKTCGDSGRSLELGLTSGGGAGRAVGAFGAAVLLPR